MQIIKLSAIDSTNSYLKQLAANQTLPDYTVVMAENQILGRGQRGGKWQSEAGKNLMFSIIADISFVGLNKAFFISVATSLAVVKTLKAFDIPKLKVKWPNDILSANKKICGILIENTVAKQKLKNTIIGIGLNVNQTKFANLPQASSLKNITGEQYDLDALLSTIVNKLKHYISMLKQGRYDDLMQEYDDLLFRKNRPSTFTDKNGSVVLGIIRNITPSGKLVVELEDGVLKEFGLKELTLLY